MSTGRTYGLDGKMALGGNKVGKKGDGAKMVKKKQGPKLPAT